MSYCVCIKGNRMCDGCMDCYEVPKEDYDFDEADDYDFDEEEEEEIDG